MHLFEKFPENDQFNVISIWKGKSEKISGVMGLFYANVLFK